ncbi:MAG TPA: XrtN system VIT domain-containing protein, partial [Ohtaekwangia sp.]|nr:XrtN system VIT domain-containing protein [Ohtaekwangia sp.]
PEMNVSFGAQPLKNNLFSFGGFSYSMVSYQPVFQPVALTAVFLDINRSWSEADLRDVRPILDKYNVYAYDGGQFVRIDHLNWEPVTRKLAKRNFSLFPFHHIQETSRSLVITKGKSLSPYLRDFRESSFAKGIADFFAANKKVYVYNLSGGVSTYIRSFKELRGLEFAEGPGHQLLQWLKDDKFSSTNESDENIVLHDSKMMIVKKRTSGEVTNSAPDHLARLFAYNNIMRQVGAHYFMDDFVSESLVDEAATAYVVSPVSSLIVLETQADYERFGIKDKDKSLHNASKQSAGAVPEPHEWALIIVFILLVCYTVARHWKRTPAI